MKTCDTCIHFRGLDVANAKSTLLLKMIAGQTESQVATALDDVAKQDDSIRNTEEQQLASNRMMPVRQRPVRLMKRPGATSYCAVGEMQQPPLFQWHEVKNANNNCTDWSPAQPRRSCDTCAHNMLARGDDDDNAILTALATAMGHAAGLSNAIGPGYSPVNTTPLDRQHQKVQAAIGPTKAREIRDAYRNDGVLVSRPKYLNICECLSDKGAYQGRYVVGELYNRFSNCSSHLHGMPQKTPAPQIPPAQNSGSQTGGTSAPTDSLKQLKAEITTYAVDTFVNWARDLFDTRVKPAVANTLQGLSGQPPSTHHPTQAGNSQPPPANTLVNGSPPLTREMAARAIEVMGWLLEGPLTASEQAEYTKIMMRAWLSSDQQQIDGQRNIIKMHISLSGVTPTARLQQVRTIRSAWITQLKLLKGDPFAAWFVKMTAKRQLP